MLSNRKTYFLQKKSAEKLWYRIFITTIFVKYNIRNTLLLAIIVYLEFIKLYWLQNYKFWLGSLTFVIMTIWTHCACVQFYRYMFAFHRICYYLMIRFKQCNKSLEKWLQNDDISSLNKIVVEHNSICQLASEFNTFWKIILFIDALMYWSLLCFKTYLGILSSLELCLRISDWGEL